MAKIISRASKSVDRLKAELTECRAYTLANNFSGQVVDPNLAWVMLYGTMSATLSRDAAGTVYTVRASESTWYELRQDPGLTVTRTNP